VRAKGGANKDRPTPPEKKGGSSREEKENTVPEGGVDSEAGGNKRRSLTFLRIAFGRVTKDAGDGRRASQEPTMSSKEEAGDRGKARRGNARKIVFRKEMRCDCLRVRRGP